MSGLRQTPQQARSAERVQVILGAAERAIAELGYEGATTNHIAAAAGISVGSLYRWFPDKESIATELVRTRLAQVAQHAADAFAEAHDEPTPALVRAVVRAVARPWLSSPALSVLVAASLGPSAPDSPAGALRQMLFEQAAALLDLRVPGIPDDERMVVARTCVALVEGAMLNAAAAPAAGEMLVDEAAYAIAAYLAMKYPFPDSHRWLHPMEGLPPSRVSVK